MYDFSVIMATYNSARTVARALDSLGRQQGVSIQFIVVDGLSTDNTVEIINEILAPDILISELDNGIAQAWNKGLSSAEGKYIAFLNSDDVYPEGYLKSRFLHLNSCPPKTISFSDTILITEDSKSELIDGCLNENLSYGIGFSHTSCIFPMAFFDNYRFDEDIKVAIDIDQLFFAIQKNWHFQKADGKNVMFGGGVSERHWARAAREYADLYSIHFELKIRNKIALNVTLFLRIVAMKLGLFRFRKEFKKQSYYIIISVFNMLHSCLPFFLSRVLFRLLKLEIHPTAIVAGGVKIFTAGRLSINSGSMVNRGVVLDNRGGLSIGKNVNIAHNTKIYTLGHDINCPGFSAKAKSSIINDYVVIFANCQIMPGVTIGRGAVILGGSIVSKDVEPFAIVAGNPAEVVGERARSLFYSPANPYYFTR